MLLLHFMNLLLKQLDPFHHFLNVVGFALTIAFQFKLLFHGLNSKLKHVNHQQSDTANSSNESKVVHEFIEQTTQKLRKNSFSKIELWTEFCNRNNEK